MKKTDLWQLEVKTILNRIQHFAGFVYQEVRLRTPRGKLCIELRIEPHRSRRGKCSECRRPALGYDRLPERWWLFVEHIPWSEGKRPITTAMMGFLARWARHLSWRQSDANLKESRPSASTRFIGASAREFFHGYSTMHRQTEEAPPLPLTL